MTLEELKAIVADTKTKTEVIRVAGQDLHSLVEEIEQALLGIAGECINIDDLVAKYTPIYLGKLTVLETAADALGSDILH
jgi:hypothetical protein